MSAIASHEAACGEGRAGFALDKRRADELERIFAANGLFAARLDGYRVRDSQLTMAHAVATVMQASQRLPGPKAAKIAAGYAPAQTGYPAGGGVAQSAGKQQKGSEGGASDDANTLIVEAGTGTGKTFAYLVPALLWGGKVIVSTGTKHLQDQLFQRDVPTVRNVLAVPVSVAILKGRANYLCHYYLQRTVNGAHLPSRQDAAQLREIIRFAKLTRSGDKAELASVPENAPIWGYVTSTRENCLGQECPHWKDCFVMQARRDAQQADIVIVNHHLFFADIMLRDTGVAELLPSANTVIFDEAHQLPETATLFFGDALSTSQLIELARDAVAEGLQHARDAGDWAQLGKALERAARDIRLAFSENTARLSAAQLGDDHPLYDALKTVDHALCALISALTDQAQRAESLAACLRRASEWRQRLTAFLKPAALASIDKPAQQQSKSEAGPALESWPPSPACSDGSVGSDDKVRWVEVFAQTVQLHQTPLSIAPIFAKQREGAPRAWIFTSATLSVKGDFSHYAAQMGLAACSSISLPSPFDYHSQALLYVPRAVPQPSSPGFTDAAFHAALPVIEAAGGRAFVLCTTLRAVDQIAVRLRDAIAAHGWNFPLFVQGEASRTELLDRFRQAGNAILVGSQSFWEGVDVRGKALSLVIIDKLPFAPPDDPVLSARLDVFAKQGQSPFAMHQLPQAVIILKQGAGRLIRDENDRGVLMICDPRLVDKPYGRRIWQSLPPFRRTRELEIVREFFGDSGFAKEGGCC